MESLGNFDPLFVLGLDLFMAIFGGHLFSCLVLVTYRRLGFLRRKSRWCDGVSRFCAFVLVAGFFARQWCVLKPVILTFSLVPWCERVHLGQEKMVVILVRLVCDPADAIGPELPLFWVLGN